VSNSSFTAGGPEPGGGDVEVGGDESGDLASLAEAAAWSTAVRVTRPAAFIKRLMAWFLDGVLLAFAMITVMLGCGLIARVAGVGLPAAWAVGVVFATAFAYAGTEVWGRASPGKFCLGLRVTAADGRPAPIEARVARAALKNAPLLVLSAGAGVFAVMAGGGAAVPGETAERVGEVLAYAYQAAGLLYVVGCLFVLHPRRRAAHDLLTGTAVYDEADLTRARALGHAAPRAFEVSVAGRPGGGATEQRP
jgi:uncharacterized RDD family membrane protein YckC